MILLFDLLWRPRVARMGHGTTLCSSDPMLIEPQFSSLGLPSLPRILPPKMTSLIAMHLSNLHQLPWKNDSSVHLKANLMLSGLLSAVIAHIGGIPNSQPERLHARTIASEAARLGISERTLYRRRMGTGLPSPREKILENFDERALKLLGTDMKIHDISVKLGYASSHGFIRAFRRRHGLSPHAWRCQ